MDTVRDIPVPIASRTFPLLFHGAGAQHGSMRAMARRDPVLRYGCGPARARYLDVYSVRQSHITPTEVAPASLTTGRGAFPHFTAQLDLSHASPIVFLADHIFLTITHADLRGLRRPGRRTHRGVVRPLRYVGARPARAPTNKHARGTPDYGEVRVVGLSESLSGDDAVFQVGVALPFTVRILHYPLRRRDWARSNPAVLHLAL
jgi:hypothetical protein